MIPVSYPIKPIKCKNHILIFQIIIKMILSEMVQLVGPAGHSSQLGANDSSATENAIRHIIKIGRTNLIQGCG